MTKSKILSRLALLAGTFLFPLLALAHEAYVVPRDYFWNQIGQPFDFQAFSALKDPHNIFITVGVVVGVLIAIILSFIWRHSKWGFQTDAKIEKLSHWGPVIVRAAIAIAFFYSALSWSFLGPELTLQSLPFPEIMRIALFACSIMIALGIGSELAGLIALIIFTIGFFIFGAYIFTYLNYLGEIIVLILFGMRKWSLDGLLFGKLKRFPKFRKYETTIVRICYGFALLYAAINVKLLHFGLTVDVVETWHLTQFHWLFPSDPLLVTLGAGLAEMAIGIFIILGFELRLTVLISLFYITLSLLYFRELVWPHLMLYGISLNLIVQPETFSLDQWISNKWFKKKPARKK